MRPAVDRKDEIDDERAAGGQQQDSLFRFWRS
jgi:hypothetical protein